MQSVSVLSAPFDANIGHRAAAGPHGPDGGNIHDGGIAGRLEMRRRGTAHLIIADEIDAVDALELRGVEQVHALVRDRLGGGRIVDEHIELAPAIDRRLDQAHAILVLGNVALHRHRVHAQALAMDHDLLGAGFVGRVVHHHVAAVRGEDFSAFRADAVFRACPGGDGGLSLDVQRTLPCQNYC
jgi:hypothetical protein